MLVEVKRKPVKFNTTIGEMFIDGQFMCYTLEDKDNPEKIPGETRIPAGEYKIEYRTEGGFHQRYSDLFPKIHKGMLEIKNIPGYKWVLIHCGNTIDDTAGCILVGLNYSPDTIYKSRQAYEIIYCLISEALDAGEEVIFKIGDDNENNE